MPVFIDLKQMPICLSLRTVSFFLGLQAISTEMLTAAEPGHPGQRQRRPTEEVVASSLAAHPASPPGG